MMKKLFKLNRYNRLWLFFCAIILAFPLTAQEVELSGDNGGYINGQPWKLADHLGVVTTLFYLEPAEQNLNTELEARLEAEGFPTELSDAVVVVSTKQSWLPNFAIEKAVKKKQKAHPTTSFVLDKTNTLSKNGWLPSPGYIVVVFDQKGQRIYQKEGAFSRADIDQLIALLWEVIPQPAE